MNKHNVLSSMLLSMITLSVLVSVASLTEKIGWWPSHKPELVYNKHFDNESVTLDDHEYFNCIFENVTLKYADGDYVLNNVKFIPPVKLQTTTLNTSRFMGLLKDLGWLNPAAVQSITAVPLEP